MSAHTIVLIVDFAVWGELRISNIATIVECALTAVFTQITIAKVESTNPIVLSARNSSLVLGVRPTKCPVVTQFTGNVSGSWQPTTPAALSVKRQPKRRNG